MTTILNRYNDGQSNHPWNERRGTRLLREYKRTKDPLLRDKIFHEYKELAAIFASRYANSGIDYDDLYQEGCRGLLRAIDLFDANRGVRFSTYAGHFVEGHIRQYFREKAWTCYVPRDIREYANRFRHMSEKFGGTLSQQEIADYVGVPPPKAEATMMAAATCDPVVLHSADSCTELNPEIEKYIICTDSELEAIPLKLYVQDAIDNSLSPDEALVVGMRYYDDLTQREIANRLGTYQTKVSRALQRSHKKLRQALDEG